jgi:tetratricopeptide (TPR) repeat protein
MPAAKKPSDTDESVVRRREGGIPVRGGSRRAVRTSVPDKKKGSPLFWVLVLVVALGPGGYAAYRRFIKPPPPPAAPDPHAHDIEDAAAAFQEAKNLIRKGQWKRARDVLEALNEKVPDLEGLKVYLDASAVEIPFQEHLDKAEAAIEKGECGRAAGELKAVPDTSKQYFRRNELDTKLGKLVDDKVKEAQALTSQTANKDKMRKLKATAEDVLAARPNNRDAQILLSTAERALDAKVVVEAPPAPGDPAVDVVNLYAGGNATGAFAKAEACAGASPRCAALKQEISEVNQLLKKVEGLDAEQLERAVKLDRSIAGGKLSPQGHPAGVRLATALYPKASSAAVRKQWGYAMATARKVLEGDPNHEGAKAIVSDGRSAANELFHRCYVGRASSPEEALPLCKEVVQMLPEGDEIRRKAEHILSGSNE